MYVAIKFLQFPVYSDCLRQAEIVQVKKSSCPCVAVTPKQLYFYVTMIGFLSSHNIC